MLLGVPPQMYKGYVLDLGPVLAQMIENMFGPRLAPLTFRDMRMEQSVDPQTENQLLGQGMLVPVHAMDDIQKHMQAHMQAMQMTGDPHGVIKVHLAAHMQMQQQQQMEHQQAMQPQPRPGPGGGQPKPGAQPGQVRNAQQPPGAMHQDQLHTGMPR